MAAKTTKTTPKKSSWQDKFLAALKRSCNVALACKAAAKNRTWVYGYRKEHPDFAAQWEEAIEEAVDNLEAKAWKRAGNSSDTLMIFLLKAHRPEKYQEKSRLEVTGTGGTPLFSEMAAVLDKAYGSKSEP